MKRFALLATLLMCLALPAGAAVRVERYTGVLTKAEIGIDSSVIRVGSMTFSNGPGDFEGASPKDRAAYENAMKRLPGKFWPTYGDIGARVAVHYMRAHGANVLLKYQVLSRPAQTWFVIIASETQSNRASHIKMQTYDKGLAGEVIASKDYPNLRPGYWIVVVGAFSDSASAASTLARARAAGWSSAYVKRAR